MRIVIVVAAVAGSLLVAPPASAEAPGWRAVGGKAFKAPGALAHVAAVNQKTIFAISRDGLPFHWNGRSWKSVRGAGKFLPTGLAASSARNAWAVGFAGVTPTAIHWNGKKWRKVPFAGAKLGPLPLPIIPISLSAGSDGSAWAIGGLNNKNDGASVVRRWNGKAFVNVNVPVPPGTSLTSVAVRNKKDVWVAGTFTANGTQVQPIIMHGTGSWKRTPLAGDWGVVGQPHNIIQEIIATGPNKAWAIRSQNGGGLLRYDGAWTEAKTPLIAHYALTSDGGNGAWTIPAPGNGPKYLRWTGSWKTFTGPTKGAQIHDMANIPGTKMVISVGSVARKNKTYPVVELYR